MSNSPVYGVTVDTQTERTTRTTRTARESHSRSINQIQSDGLETGERKSDRAWSVDKTEFPDGFVLNAELIAIAEKEGFSQQQAEHMFKKFESNRRMNGSRFSNWTAAWRNWVIDQVQFDANSKSKAETDRSYIDPRL